MAATIVRQQGVLALYSGLSASLCRQLTYSTTRFGIYEVILNLYCIYAPKIVFFPYFLCNEMMYTKEFIEIPKHFFFTTICYFLLKKYSIFAGFKAICFAIWRSHTIPPQSSPCLPGWSSRWIYWNSCRHDQRTNAERH